MDLRDKSGLLIDDMPEMRNSMCLQLANAGLERCDQARNIKEAADADFAAMRGRASRSA